jgi:hypothetical protein
MQESEYKLPHALVGCEKEEDFKLLITANNQQIHFFEEETGKHFEGNFFKTIKDLEFNSLNQFNVNLYRSFARFYEKEIGKYPSDEITLWSFNNAYRIAMDGLREPLRFNINIYEEGLSVVRIQEMWIPRDRQEVVAVICMAYAILEEEEEKSAKLNYVLSLTRASYHSFIKKMKNIKDGTTTQTPPPTATPPPEDKKDKRTGTKRAGRPTARLIRDEEKEKECTKKIYGLLDSNTSKKKINTETRNVVNQIMATLAKELKTHGQEVPVVSIWRLLENWPDAETTVTQDTYTSWFGKVMTGDVEVQCAGGIKTGVKEIVGSLFPDNPT